MATNGYPGFVPRTDHNMKYLVVSGGTVSGLGKGTAISSMGVVLQSLGLRVTALKIDPYIFHLKFLFHRFVHWKFKKCTSHIFYRPISKSNLHKHAFQKGI